MNTYNYFISNFYEFKREFDTMTIKEQRKLKEMMYSDISVKHIGESRVNIMWELLNGDRKLNQQAMKNA